mgnify:CR=1 FL=1
MNTTTSIAPVSLPVSSKPRQHGGWAWAAASVVSLAAVFGGLEAAPAATSLELAVATFRQEVLPGDAGTPAPSALARRYLTAVPPALRQQLTEQVRDEQRAGVTAPGTQAFVMRRLALYEAALQQGGAGR